MPVPMGMLTAAWIAVVCGISSYNFQNDVWWLKYLAFNDQNKNKHYTNQFVLCLHLLRHFGHISFAT